MIPYCILVIEDEDDRQFMTNLYLNYNRLMYHEIFKLVRDSWVTEDLLQATLEKLIKRVSELRNKDRNHLVNYIIAACKNHAKNYIRDHKRYTEFSFDECMDHPDSEHGRDAIEFQLIRADDLKRLSTVWDQLDERSRYLLDGYYILDKTTAELAEELGIKPESVRMA